jgi:curved DNA-binding protein CbpA
VKDYYSILGIPRTASEVQIKDAYRRQAKRWHPDANMGNEYAAQFMQDLNRAKEVLFDEETRKEYLHLLELQDTLSQDNLDRLRKKWGETGFDKPHSASDISLSPESFSLKKFYITVSVIVAIISIATVLALESRINTAPKDPISAIIERNRPVTTLDVPHNELDTIKVPDEPPERLAQMAAMLSMMQEYKAAAKYWEKALELDPTNPDVTTNLLLHYLKQKEYEHAFGLIEVHVKNDTNRVIIYDRIGEFFLVEGKKFDATNAFEKAVEIGLPMNLTSGKGAEAYANARKRLVQLNS